MASLCSSIPTAVTDRRVITILNRSADLQTTNAVHAFVLRHPRSATCHSLTSLIKAYSNLGALSKARHVFDEMPQRDVVCWTTILMAYVECSGCIKEMMRLLHRMLCSGTPPNRHTVTVVLRRGGLEQGKQLHGYIVKMDWDSDAFVGSCLIDFYVKNQILGDARLIFERIEHRDVVCYNAMISNYGRIGVMDGLVLTLNEMGLDDLVPNESTLVTLLNGCAVSGFLGPSKQFHAQSIVRGFGLNETIQGVTVDMYSKCGDLEAAGKVFERMLPTKSVVAWNSMIGGYGKNGCVEEALRLFDSMRLASVSPDHITFTLLLSACSHSGLVGEGLKLFASMGAVHGIGARGEHYCCVVDLLGRAGMIKGAYEFIERSGHRELGASVWSSLLASCRVWGDSEIAEIAAMRLFEIEKENSGSYVALAAIFAQKREWNGAVKIRGTMEENGVVKEAGCSWMEVGGLVHEFKAGKGAECDGIGEVYRLCEGLNSNIQDSQIDDEIINYNVREDETENVHP